MEFKKPRNDGKVSLGTSSPKGVEGVFDASGDGDIGVNNIDPKVQHRNIEQNFSQCNSNSETWDGTVGTEQPYTPAQSSSSKTMRREKGTSPEHFAGEKTGRDDRTAFENLLCIVPDIYLEHSFFPKSEPPTLRTWVLRHPLEQKINALKSPT